MKASDSLRTGLYRLNFFELLLSMAISHIIIDNPFFGAAAYLFADIVKSSILCNMMAFRRPDVGPYVSKLFVTLLAIVGLGVDFLYPTLTLQIEANYVSLIVLGIAARDYISAAPAISEIKKNSAYYVGLVVCQLFFDAFCIYFLYLELDGPDFWLASSVVAATGIYKAIVPDRFIPSDMSLRNRYGIFSSYRVFSSMNLYASVAMNLGFMMFFCNVLTSVHGQFKLSTYGTIALWMATVYFFIIFCNSIIRKRWRGVARAEFISGAIFWLLGTIFMFRGGTFIHRIIWSGLWGVGIALIVSSIMRFNLDFIAVGKISDDKLDSDDLAVSNTVTSSMATIISSVIMFLVMVLWTWAIPRTPASSLPKVLNITMMQLPSVFMLLSFIFALRQPLDSRNREKLMLYIKSKTSNQKIREDLQRMFIRKYRMRVGVKILYTLARPFFRMDVKGKENLRRKDYPSVFVCNHSFVFGPISAVIYLPTYFRPWIHNVMLHPETAYKEMSKSLRFLRKFPGTWSIRLITKIVCWALNSTNPIPVVRGASRNVMSTFQDSLRALQDGDNILIFPEKPNPKVAEGHGFSVLKDPLCNFYTGFAHIGSMYYEESGKSLLFYPIYSDIRKRAFRVGEPVAYDPSMDEREAKRNLSEVLRDRMNKLSIL